MDVRGAGAILGQPVTSTSEENLLRLRTDPFRKIHLAVHEVAHAVKNLGFSEEDKVNWLAIYQNARRNNIFRNTYLIKDADEYFAELSRFYFNVNKKVRGPEAIRKKDLDAFAFLQEVYGHRYRRLTPAEGRLRVKTPGQRRARSTSGVRAEAEAILMKADIRAPTSGAEGTAAVDRWRVVRGKIAISRLSSFGRTKRNLAHRGAGGGSRPPHQGRTWGGDSKREC